MTKPIFIWQKQKPIMKFDSGKIVYLESDKNYTRFYFPDKTFLIVRSSLQAALEKLPEDMFVRIHDSIAVSILYVEKIYKDHLVLSYGPGQETKTIGKPYYYRVLVQLNVIGRHD
jgi:DNA-binding LytR/AlgR family response regulator